MWFKFGSVLQFLEGDLILECSFRVQNWECGSVLGMHFEIGNAVSNWEHNLKLGMQFQIGNAISNWEHD